MKWLVYTHVLAGIVSLVVAPVAMSLRKGGSAHRFWGRIFVWAMGWVCLSAVVLSVYRWSPFLLMLAVLSYYSVMVGYRSLSMKQLYKGVGVRWFDWLASAFVAVFMAGFVVRGMYLAVDANGGYTAYLMTGFGLGGLLTAWSEIKSYLRPPADRIHWFYHHMGSMIGGFIAASTAFSVQVMNFLPDIIQWIWPTLAGTPLIGFWTRLYRKKLHGGTPLNRLVEIR